jgi:3-oxoacyl-[acyl-carrier protein] reductase
MPFRRNVLVTGAASGIGRHLATSLVAHGEKVYAADIDTEGLARSAEQMQWGAREVEQIELDVTDADDWRETVDRIVEERDRLDLLVHSAGVVEPARAAETSPEAIERQVDINLKGTMLGTNAVGPQMAEQGRGHIVNFGSLASLAAVPGMGVYVGTKFGVRGFTLAAAQELHDEGVAVTVVMPDAVDTPMLEAEAESEDAAVAFSGTVLSVDDIEDVFFDHILPNRPLEVAIPRSRGALAKLTNLVPGVVRTLLPLFEKLGEAKLEEYRERIGLRE